MWGQVLTEDVTIVGAFTAALTVSTSGNSGMDIGVLGTQRGYLLED